MNRFKDKVAVVTGSGAGIGETISKRLACEGAAVMVAEINRDAGARVAKEIREAGSPAVFHETDVSVENSCLKMAAAASESFGGIDYLVNNAAFFEGVASDSLMTVDRETYLKFMAVNMHAALWTTRAVHASMITRGGGAIVNISSMAAHRPANHYGVSKLGLQGITIGLARELGPRNVRVNAVAPGVVSTEAMIDATPDEILKGLVAETPLGRIGTTDEVANAVLFLLSDDANWITGQVIGVDGGIVSSPA